jgi:hypothetical protein
MTEESSNWEMAKAYFGFGAERPREVDPEQWGQVMRLRRIMGVGAALLVVVCVIAIVF